MEIYGLRRCSSKIAESLPQSCHGFNDPAPNAAPYVKILPEQEKLIQDSKKCVSATLNREAVQEQQRLIYKTRKFDLQEKTLHNGETGHTNNAPRTARSSKPNQCIFCGHHQSHNSKTNSIRNQKIVSWIQPDVKRQSTSVASE